MNILFRDFKHRWPGETAPLLDIPFWEVGGGGQVLIWGDSGTGKTTFLHCIGGLIDATDGDIFLNGESLRGMQAPRKHRLRRHVIAMVFQRLNLLKQLTAIENVMLGMNGRGRGLGVSAMAALDRVGMAAAAQRPALHLSAGEQQRVAVARALARECALTLADEPTASLDKTNAIRVAEELLTDARRRGSTLIVVSHDERIRQMFDLVCHIREISR